MVHVKKSETPPAKLVDSKWNTLKADVLVEKNNHRANSVCYRDTTLESLVELYSNKCACCERSRGYELQVDHYRPKKARQNKDTTYNHSGYYWLTYEWSNLIPLCSSCNQSKSNYFPLKDNSTRVTVHTHKLAYQPKELYAYEEPLLVNPEIDKRPERHFKYLPNGEVEGRTDEGREMVKLYKLNSRTKRRERKIIIKGYIQQMREALSEYLKSNDNDREAKLILKGDLNNTFRQILKNGKKTQPLSLMHLFIRNYFDEFIEKQFPPKYEQKLVEFFNDYKENFWENS